MTNIVSNIHPLKRNGTAQGDRFPIALNERYVKLEERNIIDFIQQSAEYSKYVNFFQDNTSDSNMSWQSFFEEVYDFDTKKCVYNSIDELQKAANKSPHLALFVTFLQLLQLSNDNLNELTEKHLLFFYENILQLKRKAAKPSEVVVFGEIDRNSSELIIPKNQRLKIGKDANGVGIYFKVKADTIINKATIADIKNVCFLENKITKRIKSDTLDGISEPLTENPKSWYAFGTDTDELAKIGFAFSSPLFLLEEGNRQIILTPSATINIADFDVFISTEKGFSKPSNIVGNTLHFDTSFPPITNFDTKIHEGNYSTLHPILKFELKQGSSNKYKDNWFSVATISFEIRVTGIKNLRLHNDLGKIDASKPFNPFGVRPQKGVSELLIGYPRIFNKYSVLSKIKLNKPTGNVLTKYLVHNAWVDAINNTTSLDLNFDDVLSVSTQSNYMKLVFNDTFDNSNTVVLKTVSGVTTATSNSQSAPLWKDITLDYTQNFSTTDTDVIQLFQIHPFGVEQKQSFDSLLPQYKAESYLFVGVAGLNIGQSISVHFEMQEDSGNPDLLLPKISWNVLTQNQLRPLKGAEIIKNTTLGFSQSGIVQFALERSDYLSNSVITADTLWLVATCDMHRDAIPKLISIRPQAVEAIFDGDENVEIANDIISKFELPISGIKKIEQPYPSFGGRLPEGKTHFETRVSEHLRHKGSAISIFDYERLILEAFPNIYKVKCITHSDTNSFNQAGKVLVLVIPKIQFGSTQNILQPKISIGMLAQVKQFLENKISPFVSLNVINSVYQEIEVRVNVTYHKAYPDNEFYNEVLNKKLHTFFAPWLQNETQINFNSEIYLSSIINFIEEQVFVDFITHFKVFANGIEVIDSIKPNSEKVILTSVEHHQILNENLC